MTAKQLHILVYSLGSRMLGVSLEHVDKVVRSVDVTPFPDAPANIRGVINVQGRVVPVVDLRKKLNLPSRPIELSDRFVLLAGDERPIALQVDGVLDVLEIPESDIIRSGEIMHDMRHLDGVVRLPEGMVLVHDIDRFLGVEQNGFAQVITDV